MVMGPVRSLLGAVAAGLVGIAAGYAGAQTTANLAMSGLGDQAGQAAAQTFVKSQGSALNATATAGDTSVVAGAAAG